MTQVQGGGVAVGSKQEEHATPRPQRRSGQHEDNFADGATQLLGETEITPTYWPKEPGEVF